MRERARFAPSPTGPLHIGGVRTALFNYLIAKKSGGKFILRIEDTDSKRTVKGAEKHIIDSLEWLGLNIDEGPIRQSNRSKLYKKQVDKLLKQGNAYYAFDSQEDLDSAREAGGKDFKYNVKSFSLDTKEELIKIIETTEQAKDLELYVRVAVSNEHAEIDLSKKFGALTSEAIGLLRLVKQHAKKIGLSFHVGSQCMHPISYSKGISEIGNIIKKTKIIPDYINVGGGFPTIYPDLIPQSLDSYFNEINKSLENLKLEKLPEIICEPGRAIVAESGSTVVRVNLRKKQKLYINDGTYGTLFDAGTPNIVFPSRIIKENSNKIISKKLTAFDFFGPTCDSMDYMKGPFLLPNNIKENDYIELGQLGAYGLTFRTQFNGYYSNEIYEVEDNPIMTMYDKDINKANMVA